MCVCTFWLFFEFCVRTFPDISKNTWRQLLVSEWIWMTLTVAKPLPECLQYACVYDSDKTSGPNHFSWTFCFLKCSAYFYQNAWQTSQIKLCQKHLSYEECVFCLCVWEESDSSSHLSVEPLLLFHLVTDAPGEWLWFWYLLACVCGVLCLLDTN